MSTSTKQIIQKYNIRLTKSLGQNFLTDESIIDRIVDAANVGRGDLIVEIGPGIGNMTRELAARAGRVIAIEIDRHLIPALSDNLKDFSNVEIVNNDVLKVDFKEIIGRTQESFKHEAVKVVANLPYYITTPIIMKLLEEESGIDIMIFMVQKEVAERMAAKSGGKDYGALSVAVQYYSQPEVVFNVPPHCFIPQPDVESTVVKLNVHTTPPVGLLNKDMFFKLVKASFGQRRKTLVNALSNSGYFIKSKDEIKDILKNLGIDEKQRGETLTIMQFAQLANAFCVKNC